MAELVLMPQKGLTEEFAVLSKWLVREGDQVNAGDYLFEIETGKAVFSVACETAGTVLKMLGEEGDEIAVSAVVCVVGEAGETVDLGTHQTPDGQSAADRSDAGGSAPAAAPLKPAAPAAAEIGDAAQSEKMIRTAARGHGGRIFASPIARRLAGEHGLDLAAIGGSGINGRIVRDDVLAAAGAAERMPAQALQTELSLPDDIFAADEYETIRHSSIRKVTARTMHASLAEMAQFTLHTQFDATAVLALRQKLKQHPDEKYQRITLNDLVIYALSRVLVQYPALNAHYDEQKLTVFRHAHIGVAVDTEHGLLVPTLRHADEKSLVQISAEIRELSDACQKGLVTPEMLSGGTFTATNLGALGVLAFTPVIAPPQTAILGIGGISYERRPARQAGREMEDYAAINLSLTIDHRAVDGSPAAKFLRSLCWSLENYDYLLTLN